MFCFSVFNAFDQGKEQYASACEDKVIFNKKQVFPLINLKYFTMKESK